MTEPGKRRFHSTYNDPLCRSVLLHEDAESRVGPPTCKACLKKMQP